MVQLFSPLFVTLLVFLSEANAFCFWNTLHCCNARQSSPLCATSEEISRRQTAARVASIFLGASGLAVLSRPVWAKTKSRTDGYSVQKTDAEWKSGLSELQYFVLRQGGTERAGFSVLEGETRQGTFVCAGCDTPLFASSDKFNSGTGWPSFARGLPGVELEGVDPVTAALAGAELRCATCGGHLGDVFNDGWLFVGTEAAITGKRFCIDGAALVFVPTNDTEHPLRGDIAKKRG